MYAIRCADRTCTRDGTLAALPLCCVGRLRAAEVIALVEQAAAELSFDPASCFVIGDKPVDIGLGQALKARTILVRTGGGAQVEKEGAAAPDYVVDE